MKKSYIVEVSVDVEIEDSTFPQRLKDFQECIKSNGTVEDIFQQVVYNEVNGGGFCEGVGENGKDFNVEITGIELIDY